jgi:hypothetical protein
MSVTTGKVYTTRKGNTNEITATPDLINLDVVNSYDTLGNDTTLRETLPPETISNGEIQAAIDFRNAFKQGDVVTALCVFYSDINSGYFKEADFSLENILYWYQKLTYSNKEITAYRSAVEHYGQNILTNQLPGAALFAQNTFKNGSFDNNSYFDNISDSIGIIANSKYIQLDSTLPVFDVGQQYYGVPIPYSASIENKMSATARNVAYNLSQKTTTLMRRNLLGVAYTNLTLQQNMNADASTSHGLNLINDLPTFCTINSALGQLKDKLTSVYKEAKLFGFIQYLSNIGNETAMNLRDIFPISPSDKDFTVITSEENAQASQAIAQQEADDAQAEKALYAQQQVVGSVSTSSLGTSNGYAGAKDPYAAGETIKPTGASSVAPVGDKPGYTVTNVGDKQYISKEDLYKINLYNVQNSDLVGTVPKDGATYGIKTGSAEEWANYFTRQAPTESDTTRNGLIRINQSYTEKFIDPATGKKTISEGLFSMTVGQQGLTKQNIYDPAANSKAAINLSASLIKKDGVISQQTSSGKWLGAARNFGPLRNGEAKV